MGGAQSFLKENDWELADGALDSSEQTIDGAEPTKSYQIYHMIKKTMLASQRDFDVTDSQSNLLFHVRPSPGTIAGFDVLGIGCATSDEYILRVTVDLARRNWIVYRFDRPVFEGQKPDRAATEKFAIEQQTDRKELAARISASLTVHSFSEDGLDPIVSSARPPTIVPKHLLYKVCCVTVSWSRYMAVAAYFGPPTVGQLFQSKKNKEAVDEFYLNDDDDDEGDIFSEASKIAERIRCQRSLADDLVDESETSFAADSTTGGDDDDADEGECHDGDEEEKNDANGIYNDPEAPAIATTTSYLDNNETEQEKERPPASDVLDESENSINVEKIDATANFNDPETALTTPCNLEQKETEQEMEQPAPSHDFDDESENVNEADNGVAANTGSIPKHNATSHDDDDNDDDTVAELLQSVSMPELTQDASSVPSKAKLSTWLKQKSQSLHKKSKSLHEKSKSMLRKSSSCDDADGSSNGGGYASFLGVGSKSAADEDPLQGVIHLDKPLLMCQEIYTRIIGNHQTCRVSKAKVLTLLKQEMEQHVQDEGGEDNNTDIAHENKDADADGPNAAAPALSAVADLEVETSPGNGATESKEDTDDEDQKDSSSKSAPSESIEQPLVGYWAWEHSLRTHKIKMHLAKGSDLALHVVLAVLVNQVRYERNVVAMAV